MIKWMMHAAALAASLFSVGGCTDHRAIADLDAWITELEHTPESAPKLCAGAFDLVEVQNGIFIEHHNKMTLQLRKAGAPDAKIFRYLELCSARQKREVEQALADRAAAEKGDLDALVRLPKECEGAEERYQAIYAAKGRPLLDMGYEDSWIGMRYLASCRFYVPRAIYRQYEPKIKAHDPAACQLAASAVAHSWEVGGPPHKMCEFPTEDVAHSCCRRLDDDGRASPTGTAPIDSHADPCAKVLRASCVGD